MAETTLEHDEPSIITRLEKGFQDQEVSFQATRDDVNALKAAYTVVQRDMMNLTNALDRLEARFEESRKTNWPLIAAVSTLAPLMIAGIAFFMSSNISNAISPVQSEVVQIQTSTKAVDERVQKLETLMATEVAERRSSHAEVRVQLAEVEQQFRSTVSMETLRAAQQERLNAMIWEKLRPGERYPIPSSLFPDMGSVPAGRRKN